METILNIKWEIQIEKLPENFEIKLKTKMNEVKLSRLVKFMAVPSFVQDKNKAYAMDVLSEYLSQDENSPLYQKLVAQDKKALSVAAHYDGVSRSYGSFSFSAVPVGNLDENFEKTNKTSITQL